MTTPPRPFIVRFTLGGESYRIVCRPAERRVFRDDQVLEPPPEWVRDGRIPTIHPGVNTVLTDTVLEKRGVDQLGAEQWLAYQGNRTTIDVLAAVLGQFGLEAGASEIDLGHVIDA